jgi:hypothetical protein
MTGRSLSNKSNILAELRKIKAGGAHSGLSPPGYRPCRAHICEIIQIVNNLDDFTTQEPYEAAIAGVFHGALYEKARVAAGRKRAASRLRARASFLPAVRPCVFQQ